VHRTQPTNATKGNPAVYGESMRPAFIPQNDWILVSGFVSRSSVGVPTWKEVDALSRRVFPCINSFPTKTASDLNKAESKCYQKFHVENAVVYIADNQFWTMQLREGFLYLAAGLVVAGGALVLVRKIEP
jgi:hypothetical protein